MKCNLFVTLNEIVITEYSVLWSKVTEFLVIQNPTPINIKNDNISNENNSMNLNSKEMRRYMECIHPSTYSFLLIDFEIIFTWAGCTKLNRKYPLHLIKICLKKNRFHMSIRVNNNFKINVIDIILKTEIKKN